MDSKKFQPILIIYFNRPQHLKLLLSSLKSFSPPVLYFACDGPRIGNQSDLENIKKCNYLIKEIVDWKCKKFFFKSSINKGCDVWVPEAISWLFRNEFSGIILEDDCLIDNNFYEFSCVMLERHKNNTKIMSISGQNPMPKKYYKNNSYFYSCYALTWGWATWRYAWINYINSFKSICFENEIKDWLNKNSFSNDEIRYWERFSSKLKRCDVNFWDTKWIFSIWLSRSYSITPGVNLIKNIGYGKDATHTKSKLDVANLKINKLNFPLIHPRQDFTQLTYDRLIYKFKFKFTFFKKIIYVFKLFFGRR